jgi:3-oxoadipate enol-lactonase
MVESSLAEAEPLGDGLPAGLAAGRGATLVCLHGMLLDHRMFAPQLAGLSAHMRVVAYDQRSRDERASSPYDLGALAGDCAAVIERVADGPVLIAGMSMGGLIALRVALEHRDLVSGVVLIATSALAEPPTEREQLRAAFAANRERQSLPSEFAHPEAEAHFAERTRRLRPDLVRDMAATISTRGGLAAWHELMSWLDEDLEPTLSGLMAPVLVVHGDEDRLVPLSRALPMHEQLPNSRLLVVPYAGHAVNIEAPDLVNDAITQFAEESAS